MAAKRNVPSYRHHKPSNQAFVELNGKRVYLGVHGTARSRQRYDQVIAEWLANGRHLPVAADEITIVELTSRFWEHVQCHYRRADGSLTNEPNNYRQALKPLVQLYGATSATLFGPLALKAVRQNMIERGWCRSFINKQIGRVKRMFKWATAQELIPPNVHLALQAVADLQRGRSDANIVHVHPLSVASHRQCQAVNFFACRRREISERKNHCPVGQGGLES